VSVRCHRMVGRLLFAVFPVLFPVLAEARDEDNDGDLLSAMRAPMPPAVVDAFDDGPAIGHSYTPQRSTLTPPDRFVPNRFAPDGLFEDGTAGPGVHGGFGAPPDRPPAGAIGRLSANGAGEPNWYFLPPGLIYHSYLAGEKEPRFASSFLYQNRRGWIWEVSLGGRMGLLKYGTLDVDDPNGFQIDIEGGAMPRLDMEQQQDVDAVDFRIGVPITWRNGNWAFKAGYYHISSHLGDEFMLKHPEVERINYVRDSWILGTVYHFTDAFRVYGEAGYAFHRSGGVRPMMFQFGAEYSPLHRFTSPFAAINGHLREEVNYGGSVNVTAGWQWRSNASGHLFRMGVHYYNGKSMQYSFFQQHEQHIGLGAWLDF
jgi:hypothetical protein